jgi:hypothetical protein
MAIWYSVIEKTQKWFLSVAGVVTAVFGIYLYGRNRGSTDTKVKIERADHAKAKQVQDAADRARRADGDNLPPIERLRRAKRLRDL